MCWSFTSLVDLYMYKFTMAHSIKRHALIEKVKKPFFFRFFISLSFFNLSLMQLCSYVYCILPNKCVKATDCVIKKNYYL